MINNLERCGINKRFYGCSFANIEKEDIPASIREPYSQVKGYSRKIKENIEAGRGLLLKGSIGTMKTTLAVAVLLEYIARGGNGFFINMSGLLDNIFTSKARSPGEWVKFEQRLKEIPLLVLDDLGAEHSEGWVLTKVDAIIAERYNRCLPVIITTNMSTEQMREIYAERVIDRLRSTMQVVTFSGQSLRPPEK